MLAAAHPVPSPERQARLARLLASNVDWPTLITHVERHGVGALVYSRLRGLPVAEPPPEASDALAGLARTCVASNLRLRHELRRLLEAFAHAGVPVMPLKGPVLADQLYPVPALRQSSDLDVLVRPVDAAAAERVLEQLGYVRRREEEQGAAYHAILTAEGGVDVELHHDLGEAHVSRLDVHAVWASAVPGRWEAQSIWRMALPDQLLYLGFHAVKDGLASLRTLVDIALLVDRHREELRWPSLAARVTAVHLGPAIYLSLGEARRLLDARVPEPFLASIRPRHTGWRVGQALFRWRGEVLHARDDLLVGPFMAVLMLLWEDSWRAKLRHLRRNVLPSRRLQARWTSLPGPVSWLVWYPAWIAHAIRHMARQLTAR